LHHEFNDGRGRTIVTQAAAPSFDPSIGEAYTALLAGATLVLAPRAAVTSGLDRLLHGGAAAVASFLAV
jgi:non-ribosomal peptide synthetase component F